MARYDYIASRELSLQPFYALIMAAMRKADSYNLEALKKAFPEVWIELQVRYNAPGGFLPGEKEQLVKEILEDD
jgi:hypothetical protein